jgi:hypothetical protein
MQKIEVAGQIKNRKLTILNKTRLQQELDSFEDCDVQIVIKKRGKRSSQQNRYYFGVVIDEIRRELLRRGTRATAEEVHEALKLKFNPHREVNTETGQVLLEIGQTTTDMNKQEFGEFIDRIIQWAAESLEITIPSPGEQVKMFE